MIAAFFFFGFRLSPQDLQPRRTEWEPESIMIDGREPTASNDGGITAWSLLGDPTIMTQPRRELGLSILDRHPVERFFQSPHELKVAMPEIAVEIPDFTAPSLNIGTQPTPKEDLQNHWPTSLPKPEPMQQQTLPRQLIWRVNGRELPEPPLQIALAEIKEKAQTATPLRPTRLEWWRNNQQSHVRWLVRESCGNPELDLLAVRALQSFFFGWDYTAAETDPAEPEQQTALTPPPTGQSLQVEIEWRLALPRQDEGS